MQNRRPADISASLLHFLFGLLSPLSAYLFVFTAFLKSHWRNTSFYIRTDNIFSESEIKNLFCLSQFYCSLQ